MIRVLILLILISCTKDPSDLPGSIAPKSITHELVPYAKEATPGSAADELFQEKLEQTLENKLKKTDRLKLYQNGEAFGALQSMLNSADKFFLMNVLSFDCDAASEPFVKNLEYKVKAGLDVRLITNKFFGYLTKSCLNRLEASGIKVSLARTHSSYFINDKNELLIGSQSVARMFINADGFNSLDRDMMLFASGEVVTDAIQDFTSNWIETEGGGEDLIKILQTKKMHADKLDLKEKADYCRFTAERPASGISDIQHTWESLIESSKQEIIFSGVRVEAEKSSIASKLKDKSKIVDVRYIGNGLLSGDGELTMVIDEWISDYPLFSGLLSKIREWDSVRVAKDNREQYLKLMHQSKIKFYTFHQFIHYKVWAFDYPAFFIGSANLDETKFGKVSEAGLFCLSPEIYKELRTFLERDMRNSTIYEGGK